MRVLQSFQREDIADAVMAKYAMAAPVLEATLYSLAVDRVERLGGYDQVTLHDLAREFRKGSGDAGICFEYAVHEAIANKDPLIWDRASEVIENFCGIPGGAGSILFGPEKNGRIPVIESVQNALTDDSRVYVGNVGQPPKLRRYIPQIVRAHFRAELRNTLPRSINGLWKADLFLGNGSTDKWVGTTVKVKPAGLVGAKGLRIGIYPQLNAKDRPRKDEDLNLIRLPLPYKGDFMEAYYKSFFLIRAFLRADAAVPDPEHLPDAEDRFITEELQKRRGFPVLRVIAAMREMSQEELLETRAVETVQPTATLSEEEGLEDQPPVDVGATSISLSPTAGTAD